MHLDDRVAFGRNEMRCAGRNDYKRSNWERSETRCIEGVSDTERPSTRQDSYMLVPRMCVGLEREAGR